MTFASELQTPLPQGFSTGTAVAVSGIGNLDKALIADRDRIDSPLRFGPFVEDVPAIASSPIALEVPYGLEELLEGEWVRDIASRSDSETLHIQSLIDLLIEQETLGTVL